MKLNIKDITDGRVSNEAFVLRYAKRLPVPELTRLFTDRPIRHFIIMWKTIGHNKVEEIVWVKNEDVYKKMLNEVEFDDRWELGLVEEFVINQFLDYMLEKNLKS